MFDSLAYLKKLEAVGVPRAQAEVQVEVMVHALNDNFATKEDVNRVELSLRTDFAKLRGEFAELRGEFAELRGEFAKLKAEFAEFRSDVRADFASLKATIESLESRLLVKQVSITVGALALFSAITKFL